jgi:hypothetical protein
VHRNSPFLFTSESSTAEEYVVLKVKALERFAVLNPKSESFATLALGDLVKENSEFSR